MQDLVGIGVADAAEEARIGERALQRVVLGDEARGEGVARRPPAPRARRDRAPPVPPRPATRCSDARRRCPPRSVRACRWRRRTAPARCARSPCAGASQCRRPAIIRCTTRNSSPSSADHDALAEPPTPTHAAARGRRDRRQRGAQQERIEQADRLEPVPDDARGEALEVDRDVGQLGHRASVPAVTCPTTTGSAGAAAERFPALERVHQLGLDLLVAGLRGGRARRLGGVEGGIGEPLAEVLLLGLQRVDAIRQRVELALLLVAQLARLRGGRSRRGGPAAAAAGTAACDAAAPPSPGVRADGVDVAALPPSRSSQPPPPRAARRRARAAASSPRSRPRIRATPGARRLRTRSCWSPRCRGSAGRG